MTQRLPKALTLGLLIALTGCGTIPTDHDRTRSQAFNQGADTTLGRIFAEPSASSSESGFRLLEGGAESLNARLGLSRLAERSIDTQYFIWNSDTAGRLIAGHLLLAAERGVRIRMLVDDFNLGQRDARIAIFNSHPSIEIRLFNPVAGNARATTLTRLLGVAAIFQTLNHRMHNKMFLVDGTAAVVGGRNVGDEYYGLSHHHNLRDRDVLTIGDLVPRLGESFDEYWNNEWAIPFEAVESRSPAPGELAQMIADIGTFIEAGASLPFEINQTRDVLEQQFAELARELIWADASLTYDDPDLPAAPTDDQVQKDTVQSRLVALLKTAKREVIIESPYLVPKRAGLSTIKELVERGVEVSILTNSLSSTDVVPAQSGYAKHRLALLATGAHLYEMRHDRFREPHTPVASVDHEAPIAGLHAKSMTIDREVLYVGSFNADQRSALVNTEVAVIIRSPELARRVAEGIDRHLSPRNAWRMVLDEDGTARWTGEDDNGEPLEYSVSPDTSFGRRFKTGFFSLLPIDSLL